MLLDCLQVVAVVLALDVMWRTPDWLPAALSGLLVTQQHTWQWVSLDCLLPAELLLSPAVFNSIGVMVLPGERTAASTAGFLPQVCDGYKLTS